MSHEALSQALMSAANVGMIGKSGIGNILGVVAKGLGVVDEYDQSVPILGAVTDALTVAAGAGSLIAAAFDKPPSPK